MPGKIVDEQYFYDIADAIRNKNGESTLYRPQDMANAILNINMITSEVLDILNKTIVSINDSNEEIISIRNNAFCNCNLLTTVSLPACTTIGNMAFFNCTSLTTASLPVCTTITNKAFFNCTSLTTVSLPVCTTIVENTFSYCSSLTTIDLPACRSIGYASFSYCTSLTSITLSGSNVCTLGTSVFYNTPIASGNGYIYVPSNLVNTYKSATNWSNYANQIVAIPSE